VSGLRNIEDLKRFSEVLLDSYFIVDRERNVLDFNRAFHQMVPRSVARQLKGMKCYDVLDLEICKDRCIALECLRRKSHVRLDEIQGTVREGDPVKFILSAIPLYREGDDEPSAVMVTQRNVIDEANVQAKYRQMLDAEAREKERLSDQIRARTDELLKSNDQVMRLQRELMSYKKGLQL
jgi:PAS domain-containing protein